MDSQGTKRITLHIPVQANRETLPSSGEIQALVAEATTEQQKTLEACEQDAQVGIARVDAQLAYDDQLTREAMGESPAEAAPAPTPAAVEKTAINYNFPPSWDPSTIAINKAFFPESLAVGAIIDLGDGMCYKLVSKTTGQLSKGPEDSSQWIFERMQNMYSDPATYRVNNY